MKSAKELSGSSDDLIIIEPGMGEAIPYRNLVITRRVFSTQATGLWPCGELCEAPEAEVSFHSHHEPETFFFLEGSYTFYAGDHTYNIGSGALIFIPPNTVLRFSAGPQEDVSFTTFLLSLTRSWQQPLPRRNPKARRRGSSSCIIWCSTGSFQSYKGKCWLLAFQVQVLPAFTLATLGYTVNFLSVHPDHEQHE